MMKPNTEYSLQIEAIDADGKTPSDIVYFRVASTGKTVFLVFFFD